MQVFPDATLRMLTAWLAEGAPPAAPSGSAAAAAAPAAFPDTRSGAFVFRADDFAEDNVQLLAATPLAQCYAAPLAVLQCSGRLVWGRASCRLALLPSVPGELAIVCCFVPASGELQRPPAPVPAPAAAVAPTPAAEPPAAPPPAIQAAAGNTVAVVAAAGVSTAMPALKGSLAPVDVLSRQQSGSESTESVPLACQESESAVASTATSPFRMSTVPASGASPAAATQPAGPAPAAGPSATVEARSAPAAAPPRVLLSQLSSYFLHVELVPHPVTSPEGGLEWIAASKCTIVAVLGPVRHLLGMAAEELVGTPLLDSVASADVPVLRAAWLAPLWRAALAHPGTDMLRSQAAAASLSALNYRRLVPHRQAAAACSHTNADARRSSRMLPAAGGAAAAPEPVFGEVLVLGQVLGVVSSTGSGEDAGHSGAASGVGVHAAPLPRMVVTVCETVC